jgi:hypothetical protein
MIILNKLFPAHGRYYALLLLFSLTAHAQTNSGSEANNNNKRDNIIKKNLEAKNQTPIEEIEKIIIEGTRDPESLPKKKKTVEQKMDAALNPKASLPDPPPIGYQIQCVKECVGPFCCHWEPGPRSYLQPDTVHK